MGTVEKGRGQSDNRDRKASADRGASECVRKLYPKKAKQSSSYNARTVRSMDRKFTNEKLKRIE